MTAPRSRRLFVVTWRKRTREETLFAYFSRGRDARVRAEKLRARGFQGVAIHRTPTTWRQVSR